MTFQHRLNNQEWGFTHRMVFFIIVSALWFLPTVGVAQELFLLSVDVGAFPMMKASYVAVDKNGAWLQPTDVNHELYEGGVKQVATFPSCPSTTYAVSAGVLVDTHSYIELARDGVRRLISFMEEGRDEIGITAMDRLVRVHKDFTGRKAEAIGSVDTIQAATGVDIQSMFYAPISGGIPFIAPRLGQKKALILISDLHCPNLNIDTTQLFADAARFNIAIFSVLLHTNDATGLFAEIARRTGGAVYNSVTTVEQIDDVFKRIALRVKHDPCTVEWVSKPPCRSEVRNVDLKIPDLKLIDSATYRTPINATAHLDFNPSLLVFDDVPVGEVRTVNVTITSPYYPTGEVVLVPTSGMVTVQPSSINLGPGETVTVQVTYIASDSLSQSFEIRTQQPLGACSPSLAVVLRYFHSPRPPRRLVLTHPNGNERFVVGSDTVITWTGILDQESVDIHYSADAGRTWTKIADSVAGGRYEWSPLPKQSSDSCLIRVIQPMGDYRVREINLDAGYGAPYPKWSRTGRYATFVTLQPYTTFVYDAETQTKIAEIDNFSSIPVNVDWSPDERELYITSRDYDLNVYNTLTWTIDRKLVNNWNTARPILGSALNGRGDEMAVLKDGAVLILNAKTGDTLYTHNVGEGAFTRPTLTWSPDDAYLAISELDRRTFYLYERSTGIVRELVIKGSGAGSLTWHPTSKQFAIRSDTVIYLWRVSDPTPIDSIYGHKKLVDNLAWHPNGSVLASFGYGGEVILWDVPSRTIIREMTVAEESSSVSFNYDGSMLMLGYYGRLYFYDGLTGEFLHQYSTILAGSLWNPWKNTVLSTDEAGRVEWIDVPNVAQADESDTLFAIVAPNITMRIDNIDMGVLPIGGLKDSTVTAVICNEGRVAVKVMGVVPTPPSPHLFLLGGGGEFNLEPGECRELMVQFSPLTVGSHLLPLTVQMEHDTLDNAVVVTGIGVLPMVALETTVVDYGRVEIGSSRDTTVLTVRNIGSQILNCTGVELLTSMPDAFEVLSSTAPFILQPNEARQVSVRFQPVQLGLHQASMAFTFNELQNISYTQFFGTGFGDSALTTPSAIVECGSGRARPGDNAAITVTLTDARSLRVFGVDTVSFTIRFDPTLLSLTSGAQTIALGAVRVNMAVDTTAVSLHTLEFVAGLGADSTTMLTIDSLVFDGPSSWITTRSGLFSLDGLCLDGGVRLINPNGRVVLGQPSPQPAQSSFSIDVGAIEHGRSSLRLVDLNGVEIRQLFDGQILRGVHTYTFDLGGVPTGRYHLVYATPTMILIRPLAVYR